MEAESKTLSTISLLRQNQQTQCMTEPSLGLKSIVFIDLNKNYFQICVQIIKIIMRVIYIPHRVINKDIWLQVEKSAKWTIKIEYEVWEKTSFYQSHVQWSSYVAFTKMISNWNFCKVNICTIFIMCSRRFIHTK